jgi:uncharacterized phiE125 gp8 family phage protein
MDVDLIKAAQFEPVLLSEVRDFLKIETRQEDALLLGLISAARRACETYIGRFLIAQEWCLTVNDFRASVLNLPFSPVMEVVKIEVMGESAFEEVSKDIYYLDKTALIPRIIKEQGKEWPVVKAAHGGVKIYFKVGFSEDWNDVPEDIRQGILYWISAVYEHREGGKLEIFRKSEFLWAAYRMVKL